MHSIKANLIDCPTLSGQKYDTIVIIYYLEYKRRQKVRRLLEIFYCTNVSFRISWNEFLAKAEATPTRRAFAVVKAALNRNVGMFLSNYVIFITFYTFISVSITEYILQVNLDVLRRTPNVYSWPYSQRSK